MYQKDTSLKEIIHQLKNQLMVMQLSAHDLKEYAEKNQISDEFLCISIKNQVDYIAKIFSLLKNLENLLNISSTVQPETKIQDKPDKITGKVLIVDDEEDLLKIMRRYLVKFGLDVDTACSGKEALKKLKTEKYHYLITDLKMPVLDGQTLIRLTKDEGFLEDTIVIVITGGLMNEYSQEQREALRRDIDGFLQKPFSNEELYRLIRSFEP
ncbi:MAG: hypothetical protein A2Y25_09190 [Candidatus Melainabacteria bacterium GWF2_37_15]|nr:MAG: hypothetical protein A2Y25_09190 [Candidatus Melainabacteria bacterium GWF2_37_15]